MGEHEAMVCFALWAVEKSLNHGVRVNDTEWFDGGHGTKIHRAFGLLLMRQSPTPQRIQMRDSSRARVIEFWNKN